MRFIGGVTQQEYVRRTRGFLPSQCLAVGIDVGKRDALALIADHHGEVVGEPVAFALNEPGVRSLEQALQLAVRSRQACSVRIGIETAGHYHRPLLSRLAASHDVVELNPGQVKSAREAQGSAKIKNDLRDCAAIVDLVVSGMGWSRQQRDAAMTAQQAWVTLRARRNKARYALRNQLLATLDLVFPGLDGCFSTLFATRIGTVLLHHLLDPDRMLELGPQGLQAFAAEHGVRLGSSKAAQLVAVAEQALRLPAAERRCRTAILTCDVVLLDALNADVAHAEAELAEVLPDTPAAVLTSLPGVSTVRASAYGAALGDPSRFSNADAAYRLAGMHPSSYDSAGSSRGGQRLSRRGSPELRNAIIDLGRGLAQRDEHFAAYRAKLLGRGMTPLKAQVAVGHRAHRLAFSLLRTQQPYDPDRYARSLASGGQRRAPQPQLTT